jgi:hypothetical protein
MDEFEACPAGATTLRSLKKMKRLVPTIFFVGLIAWGMSFWVIVLGHADIVSVGRDRTFGIATSMMFLTTSVGGLLWATARARGLLLPMVIALGLWTLVFFAFGFLPYALGMFGAPTEERIRQIAQANGYSEE